MLLPLALLFEFVLHPAALNSDDESASFGVHAPDTHEGLTQFRNILTAVGAPILAARDRDEFELALDQAMHDPQVARLVFEAVRLASELDRRLHDLDPLVDICSKRFGEEHRWQFRQILNMSLELMLYMRPLIGESLDDLGERFDAIDIDEIEPPSDALLESFVCTAAVACVVDDPQIEIATEVRSRLIERWYEAASECHRELDPFRSHLDAVLAQEAEHLPGVRRLTYTCSLDEARIRVWALHEDGIPESRVIEVLEHHLGEELRIVAALHHPELEWSPIAARLAIAGGPAEDLVRGFATLDELFDSRLHAPSESEPLIRTPWSTTRAARARIVGHEHTLGTIAARLAREVADLGYDVTGFSLTAHVSHETSSDEVLLELAVNGLPDTAARIELWEHLSDSLSDNTDPFVVERLAIGVRRIPN